MQAIQSSWLRRIIVFHLLGQRTVNHTRPPNVSPRDLGEVASEISERHRTRADSVHDSLEITERIWSQVGRG